MLEYRTHMPEDPQDGAPVAVLLHGRGADESDLLDLGPKLPDGMVLVAPRAPFPAAEWGYGQGWAWYRFMGGNKPEEEGFSESLDRLHEFLQGLAGELPVRPGPVTLGGFSQGGTLSIAYALDHPGAVSRAMNFSGFLANHPRVKVTPDTVRGTRFFWGHGTRDPNIPFDLAQRGRGALLAAGADLEAHDYPIGHWISPDELKDARAWMEG